MSLTGQLLQWRHFLCYFVMTWMTVVSASRWERWWSYEGINGPMFWGAANPDWRMCKHGRQQSPINIEPTHLLFDPNLKHIKINSSLVRGLLINTGHDITLELKYEGSNIVNFSLGPLSYTYTVSEIKFHLANNDSVGSEHRVAGETFPAEMHIVAYNSDLYNNVSEAKREVKGLAIIAAFIEIGKDHNKPFYHISEQLQWVKDKGKSRRIDYFSFSKLLPKTKEYITYEGSLTQPGCFETVTWMVLNRPLKISRKQLKDLRVLYHNRANQPGLPLSINARPLMPLNHRVVRTNINTHKRSRPCTMEKEMFYQVNGRYIKI